MFVTENSSPVGKLSSPCSRISRHRSTHSSQMKTPSGPQTPRRPSACGRRQNEHCCTLSVSAGILLLRCGCWLQNPINQAVFDSLLRREVHIPIRIIRDFLDRLLRVEGEDRVETLAKTED